MSKYQVKSNTTDQLHPALSGADFHEPLYQQIRLAVRSVLEMVMKTELSEFLAAGLKERTMSDKVSVMAIITATSTRQWLNSKVEGTPRPGRPVLYTGL